MFILSHSPNPTTSKVAQNGVEFSKPGGWRTCFSAPHTSLSLQPKGGVEKRPVKWETGVTIDNPAVRTPAQRLRIRGGLQEVGLEIEFMPCQVAFGEVISLRRTHKVLISVRIELEEAR